MKEEEKIKKYLLIGILVFVIVVIAVILIMKMINHQKRLQSLDGNVLIEEYHTIFATRDKYYGKAIYNDGQIYEFNFLRSDDLVGLSLEKRSQKIKKEGKPLKEKISDEDMKLLRKYTQNIKDRYTRTIVNEALETSGIAIYNHAENAWIKLKEAGEYAGSNRSPKTEDILKILEKYNIGNNLK